MSTDDCRNDCADPLRFPRKILNRPGLSHIDYLIGDYTDIREALLRNLDKDPTLAAWTHRGADDPGIALLEGAAILGDILTFYQELYANEAYLRTARWRDSISDLVRLLGYRLSPGLGGTATFAFLVKGEKAITVPANFPLKAEVTGLTKPAEFETLETLTAYPWLSSFNLFRPLKSMNVEPSTTEFFIEVPDQLTDPLELKQGDRLFIGDEDPISPSLINNGEIVIVDSTRVLHGTTLIKIKGGLRRLTNASNVVAYKIGRTFRHFGHNGPPNRVVLPTEVEATSTTSGSTTTTTTNIPAPTEEAVNFNRPLNAFTDPAFSTVGEPRLGLTEFPLDVEVQDLPAGIPIVVQFNDLSVAPSVPLTIVRTIKDIKSIQLKWELLTGPTSLLTLDDLLETVPPHDVYFADIRQFQFHETLSRELVLTAAPQEDLTLIEGQQLYFFGTDTQAQNLTGRRVSFVKPDAEAFTAAVTLVDPDLSTTQALRQRLRQITLDTVFTYDDFPNLDPIVTVYGNLVDATQGKTESEAVLGNGDNRQTFQLFKLPKSPLTYLLSLGTPPETPELEIYVDNRLWQRVDTLFGSSYDEQIYIVREDADNVSWVQFGDGKTGARLPSGIRNVVAKFRTGTGAFGPIKPDTKVQAGTRLDKLDKVQMPGVSAGGSEPESGESAREAGPGKIQVLWPACEP